MQNNNKYKENELVALLRNKNEQAFSYLYDNYAAALYGVITQIIIKDIEISNDVLQEVFINIWKKIDSYDSSKGRLFTWMFNIARNAAIDKVRSKSYKHTLKSQPLKDEDGEAVPQIDRPGIDDCGLRKVLSNLKKEHQILINLSFFQGFTYEQISEATKIPIGTVKTRIRSSLIELRTIMNNHK
ncbi:MAG: RNA polymerase sigma factor [Chitinophagaceae bacterium]